MLSDLSPGALPKSDVFQENFNSLILLPFFAGSKHILFDFGTYRTLSEMRGNARSLILTIALSRRSISSRDSNPSKALNCKKLDCIAVVELFPSNTDQK